MAKSSSASKQSKKEYVLVISWWGSRGAYALGVLKWLEMLGMDTQIKAVFGVSAGAIIWAYRAAGYSAWQTYERFTELFLFGVTKINLLPKKSLLSNVFLRRKFTNDLPGTFEKMKKPLYIWATDASNAQYLIFNSGELISPLLGSMAIPGIFEPITYKHMQLMDGGMINNFPAAEAKKKFPKQEIIGIALNKFNEKASIKTIFDSLTVGLDILMKWQSVEQLPFVDHLFQRSLKIGILETRESAMRRTFKLGYDDCLAYFKT